MTTNFSAFELSRADLHPWPNQPRPRRELTREAMQDLLPSIIENGIIEPIVVRSRTEGGYWIIAGERRFQCAVLATLPTVPVVVRECDDTTALKLALEENIARKNIHPIDESLAFERMGAMDPAYRDPKALAAFLGRPLAYVRRRLNLTRLSAIVRDAFLADAITAAHAELLTRLNDKDQREALSECFSFLNGAPDAMITAQSWGELSQALEPVVTVEKWIANRVALDLTNVEVQEELLADLRAEEPDVEITADQLVSCVKLSGASWIAPDMQKRLGVVPQGAWREVKGKACEHVRSGLVVHGGARTLHSVCLAGSKCAKHWPPEPARQSGARSSASARPKPTAKEQAESERRAREAAAWTSVAPLAKAAVATFLKGTKFNAALVKEVIDYATDYRDTVSLAEIKADYDLTLTDKNAALVLKLSMVRPDDFDFVEGFRVLAKRLKFNTKAIDALLATEIKKREAADATAPVAKKKAATK